MWEIKGKDNQVKATVGSLEYNGEWMGECYVTTTIESPVPIDFIIGDWLEYRGERFEINYDPSVIKSAPRNTKGDAFKYENIKFNSLADELTRCDFLDVVINDNKIHHTTLPVFSFFAPTVKELADRIQANLDRLYPGLWTVEVHPEYAEKSEVNVSVSNLKVWGALQIAVNDFGATFTVKDRHITIGVAGVPTGHWFQYGKGNGLYELERSADTDQKIVTRLRAYGSTRNLPRRYYSNIGAKVALLVTSKETWIAPGTDGEQLGTLWVALSSHGRLKDHAEVKLAINGKEYNAVFRTSYGENPAMFKLEKIYEVDAKAIVPNQTMASLVSGASLEDFDPKYIDTSGVVLPDNLAITNLMLPGFPKQSLRDYEPDVKLKALCSNNPQDPYIDSENAATIGIREDSVFFDGSGDLEDIYPTLEGMTRELLIASGGQTGSSGNLDELLSADPVKDNGMSVVSGDDLKPQTEYFEVVMKDPGFNLWDYRTGDSPTISFKSGKLGGRDFEIDSCQKEGTGYRLRCKRLYDEGIQLWFPYSDYNAEARDKFVLLYIDMPEVYVNVASQRLLVAAREYMSKHDYSRDTKLPKIDEVMMARQHDIAMHSGGKIASLHDTIKEGMKFLFKDDDLGIDASIFITRLAIKEGSGPVPTYEVTLKEEKTVGAIQKIQNQIDSILTGSIGKNTGGGGLGYTAQEIRQFVFAYGRERFLSKLEPDEAQALIKLLDGVEIGDYAANIKGAAISRAGDAEFESVKVRSNAHIGHSLTLGNYVPGVSGGVFYIDENGEAHLETSVLTVNKKLQVKEVEIQEQTWVGGSQINSPAGMVCERVVKVAGGWRCSCRAEGADGRRVRNQFRVGDLARCETFNLIRDTDGMTVNRYYWRKVTEAGEETDGDGLLWCYITLSDRAGEYDPASTCAPAEGDSIVTVGNDRDPERQNLIITASHGEGSPYIYQFKGIDTFSLAAGKLKTRISPEGNLFSGRFIVEAEGRDPEPLEELVSRQRPYALRPSARTVLLYRAEDPDSGDVTTRFSPMWLSCDVVKASGSGDAVTLAPSGESPYPYGDRIRACYVIRRYDPEAGASVDEPAVPYAGEEIYPDEDVRSVTFYLLVDETIADKAAVSVQADATALDSEYRATLEVTREAIEAQARKSNEIEERVGALSVTADGIIGKVSRTSANLAGLPGGEWEAYPPGQFSVSQIKGGGGASFFAKDDVSGLSTLLFRTKVDSGRFKPDTDYTLTLLFSISGGPGTSSMTMRAAVCDITSQAYLIPATDPQDKLLNPTNPTLRQTFRMRTAKSIPSGEMWLSVYLYPNGFNLNRYTLTIREAKLEEGALATRFVPVGEDYDSVISQQADEIALSVKVDGEERAGLTLDAEEGVTLQADKVRIKNGDLVAALFSGGVLNANLIEVSKLATKSDGKTRVTIGEFGDAFIRFYHEDGVTLALKLGLDYVSLEEDATLRPSASPASADTASLDGTLIPIFRKGKPAVAQVFDEEGELTWVLFLDGPVTPDTQPYSWRAYSLVREIASNQSAIRSDRTLDADEYWQFKVRAGVTSDYSPYRDRFFRKKLSDTDFTAAASYYVPDGRYFFPSPELQAATVTDPQTVWIRRYHDIEAGAIKASGHIILTD